MNYTKIVLLLIICSNFLYAQKSIVQIDNKKILLLDKSFTFQDSIQKIFLKNNTVSIWNLRQEINKLRFDHCKHNELDLLIYADSTGNIPFIQIVVGSNLLKIDSVIISIVKNYSTFFKPVISNHSLIYIKYQFHDKGTEDILAITNGNYNLSEAIVYVNSHAESIPHSGVIKETKECEDDSYFYAEGVKCFKQEDFKKAIYNFNQAIIANPFDIEANYNLGLSYQKSDKLKKACQCFTNGMEKGDTSSVIAFNKFCSLINSK